jgi:hypothetical protein
LLKLSVENKQFDSIFCVSTEFKCFGELKAHDSRLGGGLKALLSGSKIFGERC